MQIIDAAVLCSTRGVAGGISLAFSGIEFIWAIVSLVVAIRVKHASTRILALAFFAYNAFGWVVSIFMPLGSPPTVPLWFVILGGIFGLGYGIGSLYVRTKP